MRNETDRTPASSTPAPAPHRNQRRSGLGTTAIVVTDDVDGRIRARVGPSDTVHQTDLRDASPEAHRQAALEALRIAGIPFGFGLASAWRAPGLLALHLVQDASPQRGGHELPPPETRMLHSHLLRGRVVRGRVYTVGLETALLCDVGASPEETFFHGAFELVKTTGLPVADLRTYVHGGQAVSVFTTTPTCQGPRRVFDLDARIRRAYSQADHAATDEETSSHLDYARVLEGYKDAETDAWAFFAAARRSRA